MLKVVNLSKTYHMPNHTVEALKNISFETGNTGLVAILGPSGSGKTTLMNVIGALDRDFEGDVVVNGKSLKEARGKDLDTHRRNTVGFVFQHFALIHSLSGLQNVEIAMELSNEPGKTRRAEALLEQVGLAGHMNKKVNRLSGGQKQRVAIARALANHANIILADEPTGSLDSASKLQIMALLKDLSRTKLVVVITHSAELAEKFADTIVTMEDGAIQEVRDNAEAGAPATVPILPEQPRASSRMSFWSAFRYAGRGLWLKKVRTIATAVGTSIGITGIAMAIALSSGASSTLQAQITEIFPVNNITVTRYTEDGAVPGLGMNAEPLTYRDLEAVLATSEKFSAYHASPTQMLVAREVSLNRAEAESEEMDEGSLRMVDLSRPAEIIEDALFLGRLPEVGNAYEAVLSLNTANALLGDGKDLSTLLNQPLYVRYMVGGVNSSRQPRHVAVVSQPRYIAAEYTIVGITLTNTLTNTLFLVSGANLDLLERELGLAREDLTFTALTVYADSSVSDISGFIDSLNGQQQQHRFASTLESIISGVNTVLGAIRNVLIGLSSISVLVALLLIAIVIYISVLEKVQEIGVIRAIGGRMADIRNIFLAESTMVGFLSGAIGVGLAYLLSQVVNLLASAMIGGGAARMMPSALRIARLSPLVALGLIGVCVLLSVFSGYVPARKAAGLDPVWALRYK
ncbi:MAG: ATP-binding cassette domain-containing protein [Bacillota bacterium]